MSSGFDPVFATCTATKVNSAPTPTITNIPTPKSETLLPPTSPSNTLNIKGRAEPSDAIDDDEEWLLMDCPSGALVGSAEGTLTSFLSRGRVSDVDVSHSSVVASHS